MKRMKLFLAAALAITALAAIAGGGTASATVLCANESAPCSSKYTAGTEVKAQLKSGSIAILETSITKIECTGSNAVGKLQNNGGAAETLKFAVEELTFKECNCEVKVLKKGEKEIHYISGTHNGTDTGKGSEVTVNCNGWSDCIYGTGTGTDLGIFVGGTGAWEAEEILVPRVGGSSVLCPATARGTVAYEVTSPKPLYIAES